MSGFIHALTWLRGLIRATLRARPRISFWQWADENVTIPAGGDNPLPGQLRTSRFIIMRGLFDLAQQPHVHFFSLCASARVGKTLFALVIMLYWLAERVGSVVWLDPSGHSAKKVSKTDIQPFIQHCPAVWSLAVLGKTTWQILWKTFRGKQLRLVGSGAEADMHGFNAELAILNELDRCKEAVVKKRGKAADDGREDASSADKIVERTILFPHTRLVLENATPGVAGEFSPIWQSFKRGSQHYCYLPCPHCTAARLSKSPAPRVSKSAAIRRVGWSEQSMEPGLAGWQRLTFASEKKLVPFDKDLQPLADKRGQLPDKKEWREETTGQIRFEQFAIWRNVVNPADATKTARRKVGYDMAAVERGATYQCAHCKKDIGNVQLRWMLARYRWVSHNPLASHDRISAHLWRAYAPLELGGGFGPIAKEFLESIGNVALLIKFHNFTLGLPFIRTGTAVKEDDLDRVIARTPIRYVKGQIPAEAEVLTMTIDKQESEFWYVIRAHGILWDHPEQPSWSALVDWGRANSWDELLELAGQKEDSDGVLRRFRWTGRSAHGSEEVITREYEVTAGLVDSGNETELVYEFCLNRTTIFDPYKGAPPTHTNWSRIRMREVHDEQLDLWLCWSDFFAANLYYDCIKSGFAHGRPILWWLPVELDKDYRVQLTDEYYDEGEWKARKKKNHLGDCEKMQRVLDDTVQMRLTAVRTERTGTPPMKDGGGNDEDAD